MAWEWARLCGGGRSAGGGASLASVGSPSSAAELRDAGIGVALAIVRRGRRLASPRASAPAASRCGSLRGALWVALPCIILLWLAQSGSAGRGDAVLDFRGRVGDRYRRLRRRTPTRRPAARAALEPAQDMGGADRRRRLRGARRLGARLACLARPRYYPWCWSARDLRLSSSSAILRNPWPSEGLA